MTKIKEGIQPKGGVKPVIGQGHLREHRDR